MNIYIMARILLLAALSLLSNKNINNDPALKAQAIALANQAIPFAIQALNSVSSTDIGSGIGSQSGPIPSPIEQVPVVVPSCNITIDSRNPLVVSWTSENVSASGKLYDNYRGIYDGGNIVYQEVQDIGPSGTAKGLQDATSFKAVFGENTCIVNQ